MEERGLDKSVNEVFSLLQQEQAIHNLNFMPAVSNTPGETDDPLLNEPLCLEAAVGKSLKKLRVEDIVDFYVRYLIVCNKMEEILHYTVNPHKRELGKEILGYCLKRVLELAAFSKSENGFVRSFDKVLTKNGIFEEEAIVNVPRFIAEDSELRVMPSYLASCEKRGKMSLEEAVDIIGAFQCARVRMRYGISIMKVEKPEDASQLFSVETKVDAVIFIQRLFRGMKARVDVSRLREREGTLLHFTGKDLRLKTAAHSKVEKAKYRIKDDQVNAKKLFLQNIEKERQELRDTKGAELLREFIEEREMWLISYQEKFGGKLPRSVNELQASFESSHLAAEQPKEGSVPSATKKSQSPFPNLKLDTIVSLYDSVAHYQRQNFNSMNEYGEVGGFLTQLQGEIAAEARQGADLHIDKKLKTLQLKKLKKKVKPTSSDLPKESDGPRVPEGPEACDAPKRSRAAKTVKQKKRKKCCLCTEVKDVDELLQDLSELECLTQSTNDMMHDFYACKTYNCTESEVTTLPGNEKQVLLIGGLDSDYLSLKRTIVEEFILPLGLPIVREVNCKRSLLLYGPKGVGKHTMAHIIANEVNAVVVHLGISIFTSLVNKTPEKLKNFIHHTFQLFQKPYVPAVVYLDGIEEFFKVSSKNGKTAKKTAKQFERYRKDIFTHLKFTPSNEVLIVASSSDLSHSDLDSESLCKFFDEQIYIPPPNYSNRRHLWKQFVLPCLPLNAPDLDYSALAQASEGYSAGSIKEAVRAVLAPRRIDDLSFTPLNDVSEFLAPLVRQVRCSSDELLQFLKFNALCQKKVPNDSGSKKTMKKPQR